MIKTWHKAAIFNTRNFSRIFGLQLAGLATALSVVTYPTHAFDYNLANSTQPAPSAEVVMTTETQYKFPLERTLGMSQGYHGIHPGVDLRAPRGTEVYAIADGTIIEVEEMIVGYGHFVRIAHKGTISSLYAHLDQVKVKPGQKVARGETIGTVGLTGWSTGPHLHFEIHSGDRSVNPMGYISTI